MLTREVSKNPNVPTLDESSIKLLSKLCFREDDEIGPVDLILIFGGAEPDYVKQVAELLQKLLEKKISQKVVITGGRPKFEDSANISKPEAKLLMDKLQPIVKKFSEVEFITEDKARNVVENVRNSLELVSTTGLNKVLFITKAHIAGRAYLTLRKFLPPAEILQQTCDVVYQVTDKPLAKDTWHKFVFGRSRVWGEFIRIKRYGEREQIEFAEVEELVKKIDMSIL